MGKASREKQRKRESDLEPTGHITWSGTPGATERMAYWLPTGVTPADIGLQSDGRLNVARAIIEETAP